MTTLIFLFLFAFASGLWHRETRNRQTPTQKYATVAVALICASVFFSYAIGKDLAKRDARREAATNQSQGK